MILHNHCDGGGKRLLILSFAQGLQKDTACAFHYVMRPARALLLPLLLLAAPAGARDSLGIFEAWGAFRDPDTPRCYAISMPVSRRGNGFAAVGHWPRQRVRGQINLRLSRARASNAAVILNVGERRFQLVAGQTDAWAADPRADAAIIAAMRSASSMSVQTRGADGRAFADTYTLRGAATAIDAAALGCARLG